jgi:cephalosporin hydroxylase
MDADRPRVTVDHAAGTVTVGEGDAARTYGFDEPEAFRAVSDAWLRIGWDQKYVYGFSWLGRPVIQLPEDLVRIQEVIHAAGPDVIVETGVAHGGGLIFYATLCRAVGRGRVVGVDIEIRPHNRQAIEAHPLADLITLVEGDSTDGATVARVKQEIGADDTVLVLLDAGHSKEHVLAELRLYAPLVTPGSYVLVADAIMEQVVGAPRTEPDWDWNNPASAIAEFLAEDPRFVVEEGPFPFNEGLVTERVTYWRGGFLKRVS